MSNDPSLDDTTEFVPHDLHSDQDEAHDHAALCEQLQQAQDRYLRAQAELDNYRKRIQREKEEDYRYREVPLLTELLPVLDNASRAIAAGEKQADAAVLMSGFKMLAQQLEGVLEKHACTRIPAVGQAFDPNFHQAIMQQPHGELPENTVLLEAQAGYKVHDRVIRPTQVVVSKKPE